MIYSLQEIVKYAKENSVFYKELYLNIETLDFTLEKLPITPLETFWTSMKSNDVLTSKITNGIVFKSGGTTGEPKFSYYTKDEWEQFTLEFGQGFSTNGMCDGDRIGNLFYAGNLYASFIFIMKSLEKSSLEIVHYPLGGGLEMDSYVSAVENLSLNALTGVPTTFVNLANYVLKNNIRLKLEKIFFGGEALYQDQEELLKSAFPGVKLCSVGYASVDGGHLGYFDESKCCNGEHLLFSKSSYMEIVDPDTLELITEENIPGMLVYTNLTRKLMPIIRYPIGDMGFWSGENKISLSGRSDAGARIGPVSVYREDIVNVLRLVGLVDEICNIQFLITHFEMRDKLTVMLVHRYPSCVKEDKIEQIKKILYVERKMLKDSIDSNTICPVEIKFVKTEDVIVNSRTGKQRLVVDRRFV